MKRDKCVRRLEFDIENQSPNVPVEEYISPQSPAEELSVSPEPCRQVVSSGAATLLFGRECGSVRKGLLVRIILPIFSYST